MPKKGGLTEKERTKIADAQKEIKDELQKIKNKPINNDGVPIKPPTQIVILIPTSVAIAILIASAVLTALIVVFVLLWL